MKDRASISRVVTVAAAISICVCLFADYATTTRLRNQRWDHKPTVFEQACYWPLIPGMLLAMAVVPTYDADAPHQTPPSPLYHLVIPGVAVVSTIFWTAVLSICYVGFTYAARKLRGTQFI